MRLPLSIALLAFGCMPDTGGGAGDGGLPAVGDPCPWTREEAELLIAEARCPVFYEEDRDDGLICLPMTEMAEYRGETIRLDPLGRGFVATENFKVPVGWSSAVCTDGIVNSVSHIVLVPSPDGTRTLDSCGSSADCAPCEADAGACEPYTGE
ncbi:MAG: hypothetical protein H6705_16735 [Myxococcales bacterium]|nr:hypothetical protein [Myxococcales bacterium]